ncbi:MAG: YIP1 family protein [Desulfohalobiaceae bacterium]
MQVECPHCGFSRDVPEEKIPSQATVATCPKCRQKFTFRSSSGDREQGQDRQEAESQVEASASLEKPASEQENDADIWSELESLQSEETPETGAKEFSRQQSAWEVPWENLEEHGFFPGLWLTIKLILLAPAGFFSRMPLGRGYVMPLIFYLLIAEVQILSIFFWRISGIMPQIEDQTASLFGLALTGAGAFTLLVLYPLLMAAYVFFYTAISHACLLAVKSGQNGFEGTFKVIAYANAPMVLGVIPILGPWMGFIWSLACTFFGFKLVHETPGPRILLAMALPYLVLMLLSLLFFRLGGGF